MSAPQSRSHQVDRAAWERDLDALGFTGIDMVKLEELTRDMCNDTTGDLALFVSMQKDAGEPLDGLRINFRNVCPDQLAKLDDAESQQRNLTDSVQQACDTDVAARTPEQARLAEMTAC
ncbi:hypothetical protein [Phycicoccus sp. Soil748]|uniref:hypothetical protein n=1 Tax=Phycicoccus sp. Soil748 TaxID=1736397 RepID=UPI0012E349CD|nr:hypothetical protein [Phycicoccus sp. Soil748]